MLNKYIVLTIPGRESSSWLAGIVQEAAADRPHSSGRGVISDNPAVMIHILVFYFLIPSGSKDHISNKVNANETRDLI